MLNFISLKHSVEGEIERLNRLSIALNLLYAVYIEIGPYQNGKLDEKTWDKVRDFFGFDDSE